MKVEQVDFDSCGVRCSADRYMPEGLDGPRPGLSEDVRFDAWIALRVAATLTPDAVQIPERAKWTKEAKKLVLA